jgi:putative ubiquitin-RnfH superfamily antitoxin RatB of RatAB toxin-antitoxin module
MGPADDATLRVEVVYCAGTAQVDQVELVLPAGATVADALDASGVLQRHALDAAGVRVGIWGRVQPLAMALRDRDRVELYRALRVEPKEARRLRYKRAKRADAA